jgi:POT family proton-dependent oligopeptide transporter
MVETPTADNPREPDISHENPAKKSTWFGHPRQLARLFSTEAMERFGYYGMRALLTLYLTKHFLFSDQTTNGLYGGFTALVYLTPLVGGLIADRYLGSKRSVKFGAILMSLGYFILCFGGETAKPHAIIDGQRYEVQVENAVDRPSSTGEEVRYVISGEDRLKVQGNEDGSVTLLNADGSTARTLEKGAFQADADRSPFFVMVMLIGLSMVCVGNGFFKPNISTMVGALYDQGDRRRDAGFTIFYMGINLGSFFSQLLCPFLADAYGWWAGFGLAAGGMLLAAGLFQFDGGRLDGYGERPEGADPAKDWRIYLGAILAVPAFYFLFTNLMNSAESSAEAASIGAYILSLPVMGKVLFFTFVVSIPAILIWSWNNGARDEHGTRREFQMMVAAMVLIVFNVVFWTLFEQAGSSLTLFADRNTDLRLVGEASISAGQTQSFNPIFIIIFAPIFSIMWNGLAKRGLEPSIPVKFAFALMGVGAGFLFLVWGAQFAGPDFKVGIWWLAGLYLFHSLAELMISPVGLSMITKLSIARIVGLMMGVWFLSISMAQYVGGIVAQITSVETVGGQVTNVQVSLNTYLGVFSGIGWFSVGVGVVLLLLAWPLKYLMHGVK